MWPCDTRSVCCGAPQETTEVDHGGPSLLGVVVSMLGRLAVCVDHRQPETVIAWHRKGFRLFWTWKIRHGRTGRPAVSQEVRDLIRTMNRANPLWGAPRIHGELLKLGIDIGETSVSKYMVRQRKSPSQTWRTFLDNHVQQIVSVDFFTVPTIRFQDLGDAARN